MITLHDFQKDLKYRAYNSWEQGNRNVLAVLATGGGKSVVMSDIVRDYYNIGQRVSVIAHRNELVTQMATHVARRGIPHRIIGSKSTVSQAINIQREKLGQSFVHPTAATAIIGVDTLISRKDDLGKWCEQVDIWLGDEWHHCTKSNKWGRAVDMFSNAKGIGFTATPQRADGQGLGRDYDGYMDDMIVGASSRWLINNKFLSDYEIVCPPSDLKVDDSELSANGDWSNQTLRKAAKTSHIVGDVVANYCKYALGRRAILFATDVETADEIAKQFNQWGIKAASVNGNSDAGYRAQSLKEFESGKISVLVNVDLFDEGFDVPACDVVIMARPTASLTKYLQMIGRALRFIVGKIALVIDHVSNVIRHGLPDKHREWSLARRDKRAKQLKDPEEIELTVCKSPECAKPYEKFRTACPYCGFEKPLPTPRARSLEMVEGDLILLDREALEKMRAATVVESPADMSTRVSYAAGIIAGKAARNRQVEKIEAHTELKASIAQWAAIQRQKGFNDREIYKKFYLTVGTDVLSALDGSKTRADFENLNNMVRSWYE